MYEAQNGSSASQERPKIEVQWSAIQALGDKVMETGEFGKEHGAVLIGQQTDNNRVHIQKTLYAGAGNRDSFDVTPELAKDLNEFPLGEDENIVGMAHTHRPEHPSEASGPDYRAISQYSQKAVGLVLKVNPDGSGNLFFFDRHGQLPFTIVGNDGRKEFRDGSGRQGPINVEALRAGREVPKHEVMYDLAA